MDISLQKSSKRFLVEFYFKIGFRNFLVHLGCVALSLTLRILNRIDVNVKCCGVVVSRN